MEAQRVGGPKGGWRTNMSRLFFPSSLTNFDFYSLSGGLLVELWLQVKTMTPQIERLGFCGVILCWRRQQPPGFSAKVGRGESRSGQSRSQPGGSLQPLPGSGFKVEGLPKGLRPRGWLEFRKRMLR